METTLNVRRPLYGLGMQEEESGENYGTDGEGPTTPTAFATTPLLHVRTALKKETLSVVHVTQMLSDFKLKVGSQFHISV